MKIVAKIIKKFLKSLYLSPLDHPKVTIGNNVKFGEIHYLEIHPDIENITLGNHVKFYSQVNLTVGEKGTLLIGENTTINKYTSIVALEKISIGNNCLIGENVKIYDNNHKVDIIDKKIVTNHKEFQTKEILVGNNVWIASNVTILKGVTIGNNCIIGANVLVYEDIPENSIVKLKQETQINKR